MRCSLDRATRVALQTRALAALAAVVVLALVPRTAWAGDKVVHGAIIPAGSTEVEPGRFNANMSWDHTLKYYDKIYPRGRYERIDVINQPGVKAVHIRNPDGHGKWEGINVYETQGRVKLFVVERVEGGK